MKEKNLSKENGTPEPTKEKKIISMPHKIFLIGFMGSGKSHWGKIWASGSKLAFFDLDAKIEKAFRMKISDIFDKKGEEKFRELERYHLRKFEHKKNFLLACGGGTPCFSDNLEWMKQQGKVCYLKAEASLILEQVLNETHHRPLLKKINPSELLFFIQQKLIEREPFYSKADFIMNVKDLDEDSISVLL
ncbi:MAG: shikimate kinase [Ginsengibacter sp.]